MLMIFVCCSVNYFLFKCGWSMVVYCLVDMVYKYNVVVLIMKFCMKVFRWIIVEGRGFLGLCFWRIFKMLVNGDIIIFIKMCVIVNVMLKMFVGLLRYFRGFFLIM